MKKVLGWVGTTVGGALGWWAGGAAALVTAVLGSAVGTGRRPVSGVGLHMSSSTRTVLLASVVSLGGCGGDGTSPEDCPEPTQSITAATPERDFKLVPTCKPPEPEQRGSPSSP